MELNPDALELFDMSQFVSPMEGVCKTCQTDEFDALGFDEGVPFDEIVCFANGEQHVNGVLYKILAHNLCCVI